MRARLGLAVPLAALVLAGGCGDTTISVSSDGRIDVAVNTAGVDLDADGFSVSVDGGAERFVPSSGLVTLTDLREGSHSVRLSGLAANCRIEGTNPRSVVVETDGTARVGFDVRCARATTGGFAVVVATVGEPADSDGYALGKTVEVRLTVGCGSPA